VQALLSLCADHLEKGDSHQAPAVLGIALVAMAEELGLDMAIRSLEHLLQYGEQNIRRAVPLALGILSVSNPKVFSMCPFSLWASFSEVVVFLTSECDASIHG
jgi:26S proteasome regulatory subunit N1